MPISITNDPRARMARGFSLLEVLLVVVLIAATAAMTTASLSGGLDGMRLGSAARDISNGLRHARAQAISSGQTQRFELSPAARTWAAGAGRHGQWPDTISVRLTSARELQTGSEVGSIVFFADGASSGGRIELMHGSALRQIDIAWLTGEVRVLKGAPQ